MHCWIYAFESDARVLISRFSEISQKVKEQLAGGEIGIAACVDENEKVREF